LAAPRGFRGGRLFCPPFSSRFALLRAVVGCKDAIVLDKKSGAVQQEGARPQSPEDVIQWRPASSLCGHVEDSYPLPLPHLNCACILRSCSRTPTSPYAPEALTLPHAPEALNPPHLYAAKADGEKTRFVCPHASVYIDVLICPSSASSEWLEVLRRKVHPIFAGQPSQSLVKIAILDTGVTLDRKMQRFVYNNCVKQYWTW